MPKLLVSLPDSGGASHDLTEAVVTIGRVPDNVLQIEDISVSSRHAELTLGEDGDYILRDVGSTNGTQLNGKEVVAEEEHKLQDGDKLVFGKIEASYVSENPAEARPCRRRKKSPPWWRRRANGPRISPMLRRFRRKRKSGIRSACRSSSSPSWPSWVLAGWWR